MRITLLITLLLTSCATRNSQLQTHNSESIARISVLGEQDAKGITKAVYERLKKEYGFVPNSVKLFAQSPVPFQASSIFPKITTEKDGWDIDPKTRQMIALTISACNNCKYEIDTYEALLTANRVSKETINAIKNNITDGKLSEKEVTILAYAYKVNSSQKNITDADIDTLRKAGLSDRQILEITFVAAWTKANNAIFEALDLKPDKTPPPQK